MIPAAFVAKLAEADYEERDGWAQLNLKDGRSVQIARGCIGCTINNRVQSMLCEPIERNNMLYISAEWFCQEVLKWNVSVCNHVVYATDHTALLSVNMARLIKDLLR